MSERTITHCDAPGCTVVMTGRPYLSISTKRVSVPVTLDACSPECVPAVVARLWSPIARENAQRDLIEGVKKNGSDS